MADSQGITRVAPYSATRDNELCPSTTAAGLHCKSGKQPMNDIKQAVQTSIISVKGLTEPACLIPSALTSMDNSSEELASLVEAKNTQQLACEVKAKDLGMTGRRNIPKIGPLEMTRDPVNASEICNETKIVSLNKCFLDASEITNLNRDKSKAIFHMTMDVGGFNIEVTEVEIEPTDIHKSNQIVIQVADDLIPKRPKDEDVKRNMRKILETGDPLYQLKKRNIDIKSSIFHVPVTVHKEEDDHGFCDVNQRKNIATSIKQVSKKNQPKAAKNHTNISFPSNDYSNLNCSSIDYKMTSKPTTIDLDLSKMKSLLPESPIPGYRAQLRAQRELAQKKALENLEESNHPAKRRRLASKRNASTKTECVRTKAKMKNLSVKPKNIENDSHLAERLLSYARTIESVVSASIAENPNKVGPEGSNPLDDPAAEFVDVT